MSWDQLPPLLPTSYKNATLLVSHLLLLSLLFFFWQRGPIFQPDFFLPVKWWKVSVKCTLCIDGKQFLHFWINLPLVVRAVVEKNSECAREHLNCYLIAVKIWPSSMFHLNYQENAIRFEDLNHLTSLVWLLIFFYYCPFLHSFYLKGQKQ